MTPEVKSSTKVINVSEATGSRDEIKIYCRDSSWQDFTNPIALYKKCPVCERVHYTEISTLKCFRKFMFDKIAKDAYYKTEIKNLQGKTLVCRCRPQACHGDILVEAAMRLNAGGNLDVGNQTEKTMTTKTTHTSYTTSSKQEIGHPLPAVNGKPAEVPAIQPAPMKVEVVKTSSTQTPTKLKANKIPDTRPVADFRKDEELKFIPRNGGTAYYDQDKQMALFKDDYNRPCIICDGYLPEAIMLGRFSDSKGVENYDGRMALTKKQIKHLLPVLQRFLEHGQISPESNEEKTKTSGDDYDDEYGYKDVWAYGTAMCDI